MVINWLPRTDEHIDLWFNIKRIAQFSDHILRPRQNGHNTVIKYRLKFFRSAENIKVWANGGLCITSNRPWAK
jgi:hypothetical protein